MKIKDGFMLRDVAGFSLVVPINAEASFQGMMRLNGTGKFLWQQLEKEADEVALVSALCESYDIDEAAAKEDVAAFLLRLDSLGVLEKQ
ncbi:MAG: PqqD family protein [Clostridia bacterium]|nr:PqqD family protein [Clostridia bacterium]